MTRPAIHRYTAMIDHPAHLTVRGPRELLDNLQDASNPELRSRVRKHTQSFSFAQSKTASLAQLERL